MLQLRGGGAAQGHARRGRILLLTPILPWPAHHIGSAQRSELLQRALRRHGEVDVLFIPGRDYPRLDDLRRDDLRSKYGVTQTFIWPDDRRCGAWRALAKVPGIRRTADMLALQAGKMRPDDGAAAWLRQHAGDYDLIVSRYIRPAALCGAAEAGVPLIVDVDDVDWLKMASEIEASPWPGGWKGRVAASLAVRQMERMCRALLRRCDHVFVASEDDAEALADFEPTVLPNIPFAPTDRPLAPLKPAEGSSEVLFVGTLSYAPNREGLDHFTRAVWPAVHAAAPTAKLRIVGGGLSEASRQRWSAIPGVEVVGFVQDLRTVYQSAAFTIAPVYCGGGTKIKVIESLAMARTILVTPHALHGYGDVLRHGESVYLAETDEEMIEGCVDLLTDPKQRDHMAERGAGVVQMRYTFEAIADEVERALRRVAPRLAGR